MRSALNESQLSAVNCNADKILCLAGAGTGKTTTMLERISHLVDTGVNPSSILVLTFTNAAAFEMRDRYQRKHVSGLIPDFRTFHAFCYYVLSSSPMIRSYLGYTETPTIADDIDKKRILREAGTMTNIKSSLESLAKKENKSIKEQYEYEMLKKTADKLMKKKNSITFDHLCESICELFAVNSDLVRFYKDKYKYIFVDEFQDTDPVQFKFVKSFENAKLFVVGDALQSIYAFRGADSSIIKRLSTDPEWTTIKLFQNYRSPKTICDFANKHSKHAEKSFRVTIESGKKEKGEPVVQIPIYEYMTYGQVDSKALEYCIKDVMIRKGSTAVLCRTNREVKAVQKAFDENNIKYRASKKTMDVQNILRSVGDNQHLIDWLSSYLNSDRYADYIRVCTLHSEADRPYGIIEFLTDFGNSTAIAERWEVVKTIRRICKQKDVSVTNRCKDILEILGCSYIKLEAEKCTDIKESLEYILEAYQGAEELPGTDIYVGTIHSVKGLEFDNVYVLGVDESSFSLEGEENLNLYYVAITRAKKHLVVFVKDWG